MAPSPDLAPIGVITGAHGIRGQVKIRSFADESDAIFSYDSITDSTGKRTFKLTRHGTTPAGFIASIEGVTDRNQAELLKSTGLYIPTALLPEKDANQYYHSELIGLKAQLENGQLYGTIIGMHNFGAGDIVDIERLDKTTEMLPFTAAFVGEVKADEGYVIVFPPEYLEADEQA